MSQASGQQPDRAPQDSLSALALQLRAFRDARGWQRLHTPRNLAVSIAVECGELLEHFQWLESDAPAALDDEQRAQIAGELADVAIYLIQLADTLEISLPRAIEEKVQTNAQRYPVQRSAPGRQRDTHT